MSVLGGCSFGCNPLPTRFGTQSQQDVLGRCVAVIQTGACIKRNSSYGDYLLAVAVPKEGGGGAFSLGAFLRLFLRGLDGRVSGVMVAPLPPSPGASVN